jgi:hypothetical protein
MPTSGEPSATQPTRLSNEVLQAHMQQIIDGLAASLESLPPTISAVELAIIFSGVSATLQVIGNACLIDARDGTNRSNFATIKEQLKG